MDASLREQAPASLAPVIQSPRSAQGPRREGTDFPRGLVGSSPAMERLRRTIRLVARSDRPVLVLGPTGSGKELVVQALHALGLHPEAPMFDVCCGAIAESLMESLLFGYERGAFTGADRPREGYLAAVRGGTLFLDEIAELPLPLQAKLLRVLETRRFRAVGATGQSSFRGRVIAATHVDLEERVRRGGFREDLFYRLNVLTVRVPALDERREDIPALVSHFCRHQQRSLRFSTDALDALARRSWPGNVRQLRNLVDRLAVLAEDEVITAAMLPRLTEQEDPPAEGSLHHLACSLLELPIEDKLGEFTRSVLIEAMARTGGNQTAAARLMGLHRKALRRLLDRRANDLAPPTRAP